MLSAPAVVDHLCMCFCAAAAKDAHPLNSISADEISAAAAACKSHAESLGLGRLVFNTIAIKVRTGDVGRVLRYSGVQCFCRVRAAGHTMMQL